MIGKARSNWRSRVAAAAVCVLLIAGYIWLTPPAPVAKRAVEQGVEAARYVAAMQAGRWDEVVDLTCWMQERLLRVNIQTENPETRAQARTELINRLRDRSVEQNQLRPEGVEDGYLLSPQARVTAVGTDKGRSDLERPVKSRTWYEVVYVERHRALRDPAGSPIHSLRVGVNVSTDGYVLKASVVGNLDVDWNSLRYDWN